MKVLIALFLVVTAVDAFSPSFSGVRNTGKLHLARPDTSKYVAAAVEASKKYGPTSKEARLAWEQVEEMDSSDNSNAFIGGVSDEMCLMNEIEACQEYNRKLAELSLIIETTAPKLDVVKTLATEIHAIKMTNPEIAAGADSPTLRKALALAQKKTKDFGAKSTEAKLAWEVVEEVASAGTENTTGGTLLDECLVEEIAACKGLDELERVLVKYYGENEGSRLVRSIENRLF